MKLYTLAIMLSLCACSSETRQYDICVLPSSTSIGSDIVRVTPIEPGFDRVLTSQTCPDGTSLVSAHCEAQCGADVTRSAPVPNGWQCGATGEGGVSGVAIVLRCE